MLFETLHVPKLYQDLPSDETAKVYYCERLIKILEESLVNCVLIVDGPAEDIRHEIRSGILQWPMKHKLRERAAEQFKRLCEAHRFIVTPADQPGLSTTCTAFTCEKCGQLRSPYLKLTLIPDGCIHCNALPQAECLTTFSASHFSADRKAYEALRISSKLWEKERFAEQVWHPVFRYAKYVELVDRNIGQYTNVKKGIPKDTYARTLRWMLQNANTASIKGIRSITIYTECDDERAETAHQIWRDWALAIVKELSLSFDLKFCFARKRPCVAMPHHRYLFTDQIALSIERGFDLLDNADMGESTTRDVEVHCLPFARRGEILGELDMLPFVE